MPVKSGTMSIFTVTSSRSAGSKPRRKASDLVVPHRFVSRSPKGDSIRIKGNSDADRHGGNFAGMVCA